MKTNPKKNRKLLPFIYKSYSPPSKRMKKEIKEEELKEIPIAKIKKDAKITDARLKELCDEGELIQLTVQKLKELCLERKIDLKRASKKTLISSLEKYVDEKME